jgi:hypothetical protein
MSDMPGVALNETKERAQAMSQEEEKRVRDGAIFAIADHYKQTVSTGSIHIEDIKQLNLDDWQIQATCVRFEKVLHVELIVDCDGVKFDVLSFYEVGAGL